MTKESRLPYSATSGFDNRKTVDRSGPLTFEDRNRRSRQTFSNFQQLAAQPLPRHVGPFDNDTISIEIAQHCNKRDNALRLFCLRDGNNHVFKDEKGKLLCFTSKDIAIGTKLVIKQIFDVDLFVTFGPDHKKFKGE